MNRVDTESINSGGKMEDAEMNHDMLKNRHDLLNGAAFIQKDSQ